MKYHRVAAEPEFRILQASSPVDRETWDLINEELLTRRPEVQIRVYGFYSLVCDLSFLSHLKTFAVFPLIACTGPLALNILPICVPEIFGALANPRSAGLQRFMVAERFAVLVLQALRNVIAVPDVSKLLKLGRIHFENMQALLRKRAKPVSIFARIHSRFRSKHEARTICHRSKIPTLQSVLLGFGRKKKNQQFESMMLQSG